MLNKSKIPVSSMGPIDDESMKKLPALSSGSLASIRFAEFQAGSKKVILNNETDLEARRIHKAIENELADWWKRFP